MARAIRVVFSGALYPLTSRGDQRGVIYEDDDDRVALLQVLGSTALDFNWLIRAYCPMGNHYHLVVETPVCDRSMGMRQLNGVLTQTSNRRHRRSGHWFPGRYKAILVDRACYLLALTRYAVLAAHLRQHWPQSPPNSAVRKPPWPPCMPLGLRPRRGPVLPSVRWHPPGLPMCRSPGKPDGQVAACPSTVAARAMDAAADRVRGRHQSLCRSGGTIRLGPACRVCPAAFCLRPTGRGPPACWPPRCRRWPRTGP